MKRILLAVPFLLFLQTGCFSQPQVKLTASEKANEIQDAYAWDFGIVASGKKVTHTFEVKNDLAETLTIKDVSTSCGCTASEIKKKVLSPKESASLNVTFDSKGYMGNVTQYVYVNTDSAEKPVMRFVIKAEVKKQ